MNTKTNYICKCGRHLLNKNKERHYKTLVHKKYESNDKLYIQLTTYVENNFLNLDTKYSLFLTDTITSIEQTIY